MSCPWIRKLSPQATARLLCFPFAGGGSADFRSWRSHLPDVLDLCPVILPGREERLKETPFSSLADLVQALVTDLAPVLSQTPYVLFGYSMGAWIAYALTQELRQRDLPLPQCLFVAARRAPHLPSPLPPIAALPDDQLVAAIQARYNAIPKMLLEDPRSLAPFLPGLRADFQLLEAYTWTSDPPLDLPIHAFYGTEDPLTPVPEMRAWQEHTTGIFSLQGLPGGHFFLRQARLDLITLLLSHMQHSGIPGIHR